MSRSSWKIPYISNIFFLNLFKKTKILSVWQRASLIPANLVNKKLRVHNGVWLLILNIKSGMIGHKFGEFSFTKSMGKAIHIEKKPSKKKMKK